MLKLIFKLLKKIFVNDKDNILYYINSNNILPPPLNEEEERNLLLKVKEGDIDARNTLIGIQFPLSLSLSVRALYAWARRTLVTQYNIIIPHLSTKCKSFS